MNYTSPSSSAATALVTALITAMTTATITIKRPPPKRTITPMGIPPLFIITVYHIIAKKQDFLQEGAAVDFTKNS